MKINIAKQQAIAKIWLVLQEIQEKVELTNDVDATIAILDLVNNIRETFTHANYEAKRHYLSIFFERIEVRDKKIAKVIYTPLFQNLIDAHKVRIATNLLRW